MRSTRLLVFVIALLATAAAAETVVAKTHRATINRDGKRVHLTWSSVVPIAYAELASRLDRPAKTVGLIVGEGVSFRVLSDDGGTARFRMEREMPFFMPDQWIEVDASVAKKPDHTRIVWKRAQGSIDQYDRVWTLRARGEHTLVECETRIQLPFSPPEYFAKKRLRDQVAEDMSGLSKVAGATPRAP